MLIAILVVCAAFAVLAIYLIAKRFAPVKQDKKESLPEWCRYDYLGNLRNKRLSPEELADLEAIADSGCKSGWPAGIEDLRELSAEERAHIKSCSECQDILTLRNETLPE